MTNKTIATIGAGVACISGLDDVGQMQDAYLWTWGQHVTAMAIVWLAGYGFCVFADEYIAPYLRRLLP